MKTILLDVDGVIACCASVVHQEAEQILGRDLPPISAWGDYRFDASMKLTPAETRILYRVLLENDNLGWKIDLYPKAYEFVRDLLEERYDVVFVTAPWAKMRHWVVARDNLLTHYFPEVPVIYAHDKSRVMGDVLVDDRYETYLSNQHRAVLMNRPWNAGRDALRRASSYEDVMRHIRDF